MDQQVKMLLYYVTKYTKYYVILTLNSNSLTMLS
jgi:hypothetical protein